MKHDTLHTACIQRKRVRALRQRKREIIYVGGNFIFTNKGGNFIFMRKHGRNFIFENKQALTQLVGKTMYMRAM